ncbi:hypothetical protein U1Q18_030804 [Sarracenia purpurea var. burkii]
MRGFPASLFRKSTAAKNQDSSGKLGFASGEDDRHCLGSLIFWGKKWFSYSEVADRREGSSEICGVLRSDRSSIEKKVSSPSLPPAPLVIAAEIAEILGDCSEGGRRSPVTRRTGEELETLKPPVLQTRSNPA